MIRKGTTWLLFAVLTATAVGQSKDVTYTTHLDGVMTGFDPLCMNGFIRPDPGRRSAIFQPMQNPIHASDDEVVVNKFISETEESKCSPDLTIETVTNYIEWRQYAASSTYHISSAVNYASAGARNGNFASCETKRNGREQAMRQFFEDYAGEVIIVSAKCVTHTITIDPFEPLMFTPAFETALARLYEAAISPENSARIFDDIVWSYGTHFSKRSQLGARAVMGKLFPSRSATVGEDTARRRCVLEAAREALTPCMRKCSETTLTHFARASAEKCGETEYEVFALITGPLPVGSIENWASAAEELPDPIYHNLEPLSTLITRHWLSSHTETVEINKTMLHIFFRRLEDHRSSILTRGLGSGPTSTPVLKYGGVVIIGGGHETITSETLGTPDLPSFPVTVSGNTVFIIGSTVFSCGGYHEAYSKTCFYLREEDPTWRSLALPWTLWFHSAVTVQDTTIWFLQDSTLYSYDTAKDNEQFREYRLWFTFYYGFCAVTNQSHTFIIGAGRGEDEVWVNRDPSKPTEWEKVANMLDRRNWHACLWFGNDIFVTGGWLGAKSLDSVEVLNVADMTIRSTRPLVKTRSHHQMAVLHGKPAVLGGGANNQQSDSIEVYEVKYDTWQTLNYTLKGRRYDFGLAQYRPQQSTK